MDNKYYIYGKKKGTWSGYGKTEIKGEEAELIDEVVKQKNVIRAKVKVETTMGLYQISDVFKHFFPKKYLEITFFKKQNSKQK